MTAASLAEAMRVVAKLAVIVGREYHADDFREEFVTPNWQAKWPFFPIPLQDVDAFRWLPLIPFGTKRLDDRLDLLDGHRINGLAGYPSGHRSCVPVELSVSRQVQVGVEQLSIDALEWQAFLATFSEKSQVRFGALHCACLRVYELLDTFPAHLYQGCALALFQELPLPSKKSVCRLFLSVLWGFRHHEGLPW